MVLRTTRHKKIGHFEDISPRQSLGLVRKKTKPNTQQKHAFNNQKKCTTTQNRHKKTKAWFSCFYSIWRGNGVGLFSKEKISKGEIRKEKEKKKG